VAATAVIQLISNKEDLLSSSNRTITKVPHRTQDLQLPRIKVVARQDMVDQVVQDPVDLQAEMECAQVDQEDLLQVACVPADQVDLPQVCVQADQVALQAPDLPVALATYSATHSRSECERHHPGLIVCLG